MSTEDPTPDRVILPSLETPTLTKAELAELLFERLGLHPVRAVQVSARADRPHGADGGRPRSVVRLARRARQLLISEIAWPLGIPVIDGGVGDDVAAFAVPLLTGATSRQRWGSGS